MKEYQPEKHTGSRPFAIRLVFGILWCAVFIAGCKQNQSLGPGKFYTAMLADGYNIANQGDKEKSIRFVDSVFNSGVPATPLDLYFKYNFKHGQYESLKKKEASLQYADSMLYIIETYKLQESHPQEYARSFYALGDAYMGARNYKKAYENFYKAKMLAQKHGDVCGIGEYNYRLAMVNFKEEKYALAAALFKEAFTELGDCNNEFAFMGRRQEILNNLGLSFYRAGNNDSALKYYDKALAFLQAHRNEFAKGENFVRMAQGVIYGNQAKIYQANGEWQKAEDLLKKSIAINTQRGFDNRDAQLSQLQLSSLYVERGMYSQAFSLLQNIRHSLDTLRNEPGEERFRKQLWQYYQAIKDEQNALKSLQSYMVWADSSEKRNKGLFQSDMNTQIENLESHYQLNLLRKDNKVQQLYLLSAGIVACALIVVACTVFLYWRKSRKNVATLTQLNHKISEQKLQLENTLHQLENQMNEKDRILRVVAHDLRNPIGGIVSLVDLIIDTHDDETLKADMLSMIRNASSNSLNLIRELLEYSSVVKDKIERSREWVDINELAEECVELLSYKAREKKQHLHLKLLPQETQLYINREKMWRVISNLIVNAIKFSKQGSDIYINVEKKGENVIISVKDTGIGIPESDRPFVFDVFSKAKREGTAGEQAFGLGLSISKQIVEQHEGIIWFESEVNKMTTFYVQLPFLPSVRVQ
jgi:signal transduction histidine kinase